MFDYRKIHLGSEIETDNRIYTYESANACCNSDGINNILFGVGLIINKLTNTPGSNEAFDTQWFSYKNFKDIQKPESVESFVSITNDICNRVYTKAMDWFKKKYAEQIKKISESNIDQESLEKIRKEINRLADNIQNLYINATDSDITILGFPINCIDKDRVNDCMHYAKEKMLETLKCIINDLTAIFTNKAAAPTPVIQVAPTPQPQNEFVGTPLTQRKFISYNPMAGFVPVFEDEDITKHFVIGDNVFVNQNQAQSLGAILKSASLALDKKDAELKLGVPSRFGIAQFNGVSDWIAILLDENNCWVDPKSDAYQEIRINSTDGQLLWSGPSVK